MKFFSQLNLLAAILILFTGCPKNETMEEIKGKKWILETLNGEPARPGVGNQPRYFQLDEENRLTGFAGCNRFFGALEVEKGRVKIGKLGSTMMACPPEYDDQPFLNALENADGMELQEGRLILKYGSKTVATFTETAAMSAPSAADFKNTRWVLQSLNGEAVQIADGPRSRELFIQFPLAEEDRVRGHAGCNNFSGAYHRDGQSLTFGPLMSTKMACPNLELEGRFMKTLESVDSFRIEGDLLTVSSAGKAVAVFKAVYY